MYDGSHGLLLVMVRIKTGQLQVISRIDQECITRLIWGITGQNNFLWVVLVKFHFQAISCVKKSWKQNIARIINPCVAVSQNEFQVKANFLFFLMLIIGEWIVNYYGQDNETGETKFQYQGQHTSQFIAFCRSL